MSGQSTTYARLVGTIEDQTGAVLPGVEVTVRAYATNVENLTRTNNRGDYIIDKLIPGLYEVKAELPGFKSRRSLNIRLAVNQVGRVDFIMEPGQISEQVTVTGQSPILDTEDVEFGTVIEGKTLLDLPLQDRDILSLAYLTAGAIRERIPHTDDRYLASGGGWPSFNGLYSTSNQFILDGSANHSALKHEPIVWATPETVQEFKVITNNYSAEYGRSGGAVISLLSKSGSNEFHGHAWYYIRDERFDAANFFTNRLGREQEPLDYRIFGGSLGGPIIKDKTFFHGHYERFIDDRASPRFFTVPSLGMREGDFSGAGPTGPIPQLYNPFDVVDGQRQAFDGNRIPRSRWNPVYQKAMELLSPPLPNVAGETANNYNFPFTERGRPNKYSIRGDHHFEGGGTLFGRFSWQNTPYTSHSGSNTASYGVPGAELNDAMIGFSDGHHGWQTAFGWVNPMGPNLVTELNLSIWKFLLLFSRPLEDRNWAQELGYDDAHLHPVYFPDGSRGSGGLPRISPTGYQGWRAWGERPLGDQGLGLKYTASWRKGDHYLKLGVEHSRDLDVFDLSVSPYGCGADFYNGFATGQITRDAGGQTTGAGLGEPWADFMLGVPSVVTGNNQGFDSWSARYNQSHYSGFVNDDWKAGPNLTLNLGLRWEQPRPPYYEGSPDGRFATDYRNCAFDFSQAEGRTDPLLMMPRDFDIAEWQGPTGLAVPFANLPRRGCYEAKWRYFAPRFGLAWRLFGGNRTVLRLGAGLNYDQESGDQKARVLIPARGNLNSRNPRGTENPTVITGERLELPTQVALGEYFSWDLSELEWEEGQVYAYNLSIQHEIFPGTKLDVGYVGNQGRHIRGWMPFNVAMPEGYVVPLIGGGTATLTSDPITAGPRSWIPGNTVDRVWSGQLARRPYPQVEPGPMGRSQGSMNYNSLQTKLERRFQDGVALTLGYTWSKAMALNFAGFWGNWGGSREYERHNLKTPMLHDRTHTLYNSTIWELPFFRKSGGMARTLLAGWEVTTNITLTTGAPYEIWYGIDLWEQGPRHVLNPNRIADGNLEEGERSVDRWFDTSAFVAPVYDSSLCQGTDTCHEAARRALGNSASFPLRDDGIPLVDFSLHKEFAFGDGKALDFRTDFFNAFNHTIFFRPNGNVASLAAGRVFQAGTARQIQFGFRFSF